MVAPPVDDAPVSAPPADDAIVVDAETDAAFAALLGGDDAPSPSVYRQTNNAAPGHAPDHGANDGDGHAYDGAHDRAPVHAIDESLERTAGHAPDPVAHEPLPRLFDTPKTTDEEPSVVSAAVPAVTATQ